jgi:hypothetical protein
MLHEDFYNAAVPQWPKNMVLIKTSPTYSYFLKMKNTIIWYNNMVLYSAGISG